MTENQPLTAGSQKRGGRVLFSVCFILYSLEFADRKADIYPRLRLPAKRWQQWYFSVSLTWQVPPLWQKNWFRTATNKHDKTHPRPPAEKKLKIPRTKILWQPNCTHPAFCHARADPQKSGKSAIPTRKKQPVCLFKKHKFYLCYNHI